MLDVETKGRINTARDILVGKVPDPKSQVEQITIALIYKFMDDMDVESEELGGKRTFFVGEYAKYAWRRIFDPRQSGHELLNLYGEAIAKMDVNPGVPKLFRDIFKNAYLPYRDPETLKSFLKVINEFDYSHSEKLGDAFEYLLSILGSQGDAGQFRTPRHIIDFMVAIVDPKKDETILDPACGTAGFLISSYKHIIRQNSSNYNPDEHNGTGSNGDQSVADRIISTNGYTGDKLTADDRKLLAMNIHGYDISPDMVRLSLVNMYLHGIKDPKISEYDTLTSEDNWHHFSDVILANPPFMSPKGGIRPHKRFSVQSNRSEVLFVDYIAEHLTANGRAAVIVPEGIIFQSGNAYKQLRKKLVEECLVGVISLPAGVFNPYAGVKTSILWLDKSLAKKTNKILFVKIENDGFDLGAQRRQIKQNDLPGILNIILDYQDSLQASKPVKSDSYHLVLKSVIAESHDNNLSGERYILRPKLTSGNYPNIRIGDVCTVQSGYAFKSELFDEQEGFPIIRIRDIKPSFTKTRYKGSFDEEYVVNNGDLLIGMDGEFNATLWAGGSALLNQRVCRLYHFNGVVKEYVFRLILEKLKEIEAETYAVTVKHISAKQILDIQIPLPPLSIQEEIVSEIESYQKIIDGARQVVDNYKPRIDIDPEWEMVELREIGKIMTGGTPSKDKPEYWKGNIPWVSPKDMKSDYISDSIDHISRDAIKGSSTKLVPAGTILCVVRSGILQHSFPIALTKSEVCYNQDIISIQCDTTKIDALFLFYYLKTQSVTILKDGIKTGVTVQSFRSGFFAELLIPVPLLTVQQQIVKSLLIEQEMIFMTEKLIAINETKVRNRIAKAWGD